MPQPIVGFGRALAAALASLSVAISVVGCAGVRQTPVGASRASLSSGIPHGGSRAALEAGNARFVSGAIESNSWQQERVVQTGTFGQSPSIGVLSCADSRVPPELIFDMGVGDLFVVRVAGNFESPEGLGTFEYGAEVLGVHTILVLGHTKCGAVDATLQGKPLPGSMPVLTAAIEPAVASLAAGGPSATRLRDAIEANVRYQAKQLLDRSEILRSRRAAGRLDLLMAVYDVDTGRVEFLD